MSIYTKTNPFHARLKNRTLLNKNGSTKETFHIVLDLAGGHLPFAVGDSVGIFPDNDPAVVEAIVKKLGESQVFDRTGAPFTLREFLLKKANLCKCTTPLLKLLQERGGQLGDLLDDKSKALEFLQTHHLIDILEAFASAKPSPQEICSLLLPLMPRFYSIASSPKMFPDEIHLTVASLSYPTAAGLRRGVGSQFLCHTHPAQIPLFVQSSNGFTLPSDPDASIILIGPGTGIAPFRAFLQERIALQHSGKTWLFFGERNRATDFYYEEYLLELEKQGRLRLDVAFSRDSIPNVIPNLGLDGIESSRGSTIANGGRIENTAPFAIVEPRGFEPAQPQILNPVRYLEKTYVQHVLWERRASVWDWLQNGAYLYVCGDAEKMAKDVDAMLLRILSDQGKLTEQEASARLKGLRKERRYLQDVY